jgi:hypothetical protein
MIMNAGMRERVRFESISQWLFGIAEPHIKGTMGGWLSIAVFSLIAFCLIWIPAKRRT